MEVVAFLGLGAMGRGMAANLQRSLRSSDSPQIAEQDLLVYNRSPGPAAAMAADAEMRCVPVQECGALRTRSTPATVLCLMLANDAACDAVLAQLCAVGLSGALIINHSTVTPECAEAAAARVADAGGEYISAIVWGRPDAAAAARLLVAPGGPQHAIDRAAPFLRAHGTLLPAQSSPGAACAFKLTGNFMLFGFVQTFAEALTLADKAGISREALLGFMDAFLPAPPIQGYARRMVAGQLDPGAGFTVDLAIKDMAYVRGLGETLRAPLRVADAVHASLVAASANGLGGRDVGAMLLAVQQSAGLYQQGRE